MDNKKESWIIVQDMEAYNQKMEVYDPNSRLIGIKDTCTYASEVKPIIELEKGIVFKILKDKLETFQLMKENGWSCALRGRNAVRKLVGKEFEVIEKSVYNAFMDSSESDYVNMMQDEDTPPNETIEQKISRIKRNQKIVYKLKDKYKNKCQVEGCGYTFKKKDGNEYSEAHHWVLVAKGGKQDEENMVILCANHHKMIHYANTTVDEKVGKTRNITINGENLIIKYI